MAGYAGDGDLQQERYSELANVKVELTSRVPQKG